MLVIDYNLSQAEKQVLSLAALFDRAARPPQVPGLPALGRSRRAHGLSSSGRSWRPVEALDRRLSLR